MASLDIEQAARASGLSARDIRELIEQGRLPATRPGGRWMIDKQHLAAAAPAPRRPDVQGVRPIGADPAPAEEDLPGESASAALARLEEATAQIADLRAERDELRLRLREQVASLQKSLEGSMEELDQARARVAELEGRRSREPSRSGPARSSGGGAREALTPLFRATTQPRDVG
jgi:excisionase family DNA binding protein